MESFLPIFIRRINGSLSKIFYILRPTARNAQPIKQAMLLSRLSFSCFLYKFQIRLIASNLLDESDLDGLL